MRKIMDQEMMQLKHELKEFVERGQQILQKMEGSMGQRMYGMRSGNGGYSGSGGYNGGSQGGNYGNREPWSQSMTGMHNYPQQGYPQQDMMQGMNPMWFM